MVRFGMDSTEQKVVLSMDKIGEELGERPCFEAPFRISAGPSRESSSIIGREAFPVFITVVGIDPASFQDGVSVVGISLDDLIAEATRFQVIAFFSEFVCFAD